MGDLFTSLQKIRQLFSFIIYLIILFNNLHLYCYNGDTYAIVTILFILLNMSD